MKHPEQIYKDRKQIRVCLGLVGTGRIAAKGYRAFGGRDENVLNLNCMEWIFIALYLGLYEK